MSDTNFYVRALEAEDWEICRDLRIESTKYHQDVYRQSYEDALNQPDERWKEWVAPENGKVFVLFDEKNPIGISGVFQDRTDETGKVGLVVMGYIREEYRGKSLSKLMYEARISWALENTKWEKLIVSHREGNDVMKSIVKKHGFKFKEKRYLSFGDGQEDWDYDYELDLNALRI